MVEEGAHRQRKVRKGEDGTKSQDVWSRHVVVGQSSSRMPSREMPLIQKMVAALPSGSKCSVRYLTVDAVIHCDLHVVVVEEGRDASLFVMNHPRTVIRKNLVHWIQLALAEGNVSMVAGEVGQMSHLSRTDG